ncbi:MAG TPA: L,D-transpeptidase [Thermomicrobiaceae bacterium]|nr:L,D-transpeptidase [Thermomicrobiaceae bacterium]
MEPSVERSPVQRPRGRPWRLVAVGLLVVMLGMALVPGTAGAAASPYDTGPSRVYFPQTGHYLAYGFLDYWHHNGGVQVFGYPITEEMRDPASGLTVQYFERAVFEWHPTAPRNWQVQLRRLGAALTAGSTLAAFQPVTAQSDTNCTFYPQTGHRLCAGFRYFWHAEGGLAIFGYPISEEFTQNGYTVQYFERARFEYHPALKGTPYEVELGLLGTQAAIRDGVNRTPVPQSSGTPTYDPSLWYVPEPIGAREVRTPPPGAPTDQAKWIEVDTTEHYVRLWEYDRLVYGSWAATGVAAHPTPTGRFEIMGKLPTDNMTGGTASTSASLALSSVPYVMYFWDGYALVGGSWLSSFGTAATNGSVALPLEQAHWLYDWATYGTPVWIHQ